MSLKLLAQQELSATAVEALVAQLGVAEVKSATSRHINWTTGNQLCDNTVTNSEALDLRSKSSHNTDGFMSYGRSVPDRYDLKFLARHKPSSSCTIAEELYRKSMCGSSYPQKAKY